MHIKYWTKKNRQVIWKIFMMTSDVVKTMYNHLIFGSLYPLASITDWQHLVLLSASDWQRSCDNCYQKSFNMLNNSVSWEDLQFLSYQILTINFWLDLSFKVVLNFSRKTSIDKWWWFNFFAMSQSDSPWSLYAFFKIGQPLTNH